VALYLHTTNTTSGATASTWRTWTTDNTGSTAAVWITWSAATTGSTTVITSQFAVRTPEPITAAERERMAAQAADYAEQRRKAIACARALLLAMLTHQQREQLQRDQFFEVIAKHSKRRYRIRQGTHGNVRLLDDAGREVVRYCGQPPGVPEDDAMLAQKLQLEHDEAEYLRRANATPLRATA